MTHCELAVAHMVGTGECWDSCEALPGTFLLLLGTAPHAEGLI